MLIFIGSILLETYASLTEVGGGEQTAKAYLGFSSTEQIVWVMIVVTIGMLVTVAVMVLVQAYQAYA